MRGTESLETDEFYVYWDWGDDTNSDWLGPYLPGEDACASHTWYFPGGVNTRIRIIIRLEPSQEEIIFEIWIHIQNSKPRNRFIFPTLLKEIFSYFPLLEKLLVLR